MLNAIAYARYSSVHQNPKSTDDQLAEIEEFARRNGWRIVQRFFDKGITGQIEGRQGYLAMLDAIRSGGVDVVVAESVDRFSRDQEHSAKLRKLCKFRKVTIHTLLEGPVDPTTHGLKSLMSETQIQTTSTQVRRGNRAKVLAGLSAGGCAYGYRVRVGPDGWAIRGERDIVEAQAAVVRRIFAEFASGRSPAKIAADLNAEGVPSPRDGHWKQNTLNGNAARGTGILNNELYRGVLVWNRMEYRLNPDTGRHMSFLNDDAKVVRSEVPELRIVDEALWAAVKRRQESLSRKRGAAKHGDTRMSGTHATRRNRYLLSGLLTCAKCGGKLTVAS